jgi:hypothetical protein
VLYARNHKLVLDSALALGFALIGLSLSPARVAQYSSQDFGTEYCRIPATHVRICHRTAGPRVRVQQGKPPHSIRKDLNPLTSSPLVRAIPRGLFGSKIRRALKKIHLPGEERSKGSGGMGTRSRDRAWITCEMEASPEHLQWVQKAKNST